MTEKSIGIYYFSGTGNTKIVTDLLAKEFENRDSKIDILRIEDVVKGKINPEVREYDILGIGYPVHALNAPKIVFTFIKHLPPEDKRMFVLKTAGDPFLHGGPTTMVRARLQQKGYSVFYERLICMPANVLIQYDDELVKQLYNTAEKKAATMAEEILSGKSKMQRDSILSQLFSYLFSGMESMGTPFFGKDLHVKDSCTLCDICVERCPTGNISRKGDLIHFGWKCIACMRCLYNCPESAITPRLYRFFVFKTGYNIHEIINDPHIEGNYVSRNTKGYYSRFYDYMEE